VTEKLTDEAYARAALTYLAEPADRWLGRLLRLHGAAATLDAIKADCLPGEHATKPAARGAMKAAMERWQVRLPGLPAPEEVLAFRESGIRVITPDDPEWPGQLADLGDDQPYALWLRGNADLRFSCLRSLAVVGARAAAWPWSQAARSGSTPPRTGARSVPAA
jgi:DNA processing protein